jgi:hypothetical protein
VVRDEAGVRIDTVASRSGNARPARAAIKEVVHSAVEEALRLIEGGLDVGDLF